MLVRAADLHRPARVAICLLVPSHLCLIAPSIVSVSGGRGQVTANVNFIRAAADAGIVFDCIFHGARALTERKRVAAQERWRQRHGSKEGAEAKADEEKRDAERASTAQAQPWCNSTKQTQAPAQPEHETPIPAEAAPR